MEELAIIQTISSIGSLLIAIWLYVKVKRMGETPYLIEKAKEILTEVTSDTEVQKKIYAVGVLLGTGIRQGVGFKAGGGKFKIDNMIGEALGGFIGNLLGSGGKEKAASEGGVESVFNL